MGWLARTTAVGLVTVCIADSASFMSSIERENPIYSQQDLWHLSLVASHVALLT